MFLLYTEEFKVTLSLLRRPQQSRAMAQSSWRKTWRVLLTGVGWTERPGAHDGTGEELQGGAPRSPLCPLDMARRTWGDPGRAQLISPRGVRGPLPLQGGGRGGGEVELWEAGAGQCLRIWVAHLSSTLKIPHLKRLIKSLLHWRLYVIVAHLL